MKINYINLSEQYRNEKKDLLRIFNQVLHSGQYIGGKNVDLFENNIKKALKSKECVTLNSGTDALVLALHSLGIKKGDEIITTPNSFIASTAVIVHLGAIPIFVDVLDDQNMDPEQIEKKITNKTKAIMPVHLTGRVCQMDKILKISKKYNLKVIEDAAQAIGSKLNNKFAGTFGDIGCFSAHPLKNLNAIGDSGYLVTNSTKNATLIRDLKNHGMTNRNIVKNFGFVSRMDSLHAAILNYRLKKIGKLISSRRKNAKIYNEILNKKNVFIPKEKKNEFNTYHTFVVQVPNRNNLQKHLLKKNIQTAIHYPVPIHLQPAAKKLGYKKGDFPKTEKQAKTILTLPVNQYLKEKEIAYISKVVNEFYE